MPQLKHGLVLICLICISSQAFENVDKVVARPIAWDNCLNQPQDWYNSDQAMAVADNVLLYQRITGGWEKNTDMARHLSDTQKQQLIEDKAILRSTIDNGATTTQLRFLGRVYDATHEIRFKEAFLRGVDYLLEAQYPNGGWPQFYPIRQGYYQHITFNDNAMINVMNLLKQISKAQAPYGFVDKQHRDQATGAISRGLDIILKTQVRINGALTVWCAQHDEVTLAPAKARAYELPSLSASESVGIVRYLMNLDHPSPDVCTAIHSACAWLESTKINDQRVVTKPDPSSPKGYDRVMVQDPTAPPLWARFYDLTTNQPMFVDRDSLPKQHLSDLSYERRNGYAYLGTWAQTLLTKEYPAWRVKWNQESQTKGEK